MPKTFRIIALSLVGLALLLAILAIGLGKRGNTAVQDPTTAPGADATPQRLTMVVAARDLATGKAISLSDLKSIEVAQLPSGATSSLYKYANAIPSRDIATDTPLRAELFLGGLSSQLATGERAIAIAVDEISGVGNHVVPGDFVDVFVALPENRAGMGSEQEPAAARMIASRLRVLTYGQDSLISDHTAQAAPDEATQSADTGTADPRAQAITARSQDTANASSSRNAANSAVLAVPPDQAGPLLLGAQEGRLFLALRNPTDPGTVDRERFALPGSLLPIPAVGNAIAGAGDLSAEDRAYAGITLKGLTGQKAAHSAPRPASSSPAPVIRRPARSSGNATQGVQIIRGADAPRALTSQ